MSCTEVSLLSDVQMVEFLQLFDTVLTDCDGVLWNGSNVIAGAPEFINALKRIGKKVIYVTNNSTKSRREYVEKCRELGFQVKFDEIFTTSFLCASYLQQQNFDVSKKVYIFGSKGIAKELDEAGIQHIGSEPDPMPDAWTMREAREMAAELDKNVGCVIAGFTPDITYKKMVKATSYLKDDNIWFLGTNTDPRFPVDKDITIPGTGAFIAAVKTAAGREPVILGKPNTFMFQTVKQFHPDINPKRTIMIGDRCDTDILLGKNCHLKTLLVGTGINTLEEVKLWGKSEKAEHKKLVPDFYASSLSVFLPHILRLES